MPAPELLMGGALVAALGLYAILGGADFGGGIWDLLASGPRTQAQRRLVAEAIGPVWEVNHIWLILAVVILFSAFPPAFAALFTVLHVPLTVFLIGVVFRGCAFAFRTYEIRSDAAQRTWGLVFSCASVIAPALLGVCVGALSRPHAERLGMWGFLSPFSASVGVLTLALFAHLAAVFLCVEGGSSQVAEDFRLRALLTSVVGALSVLLAFCLAPSEAPRLHATLTHSFFAAGLWVGAGSAALGTFAALWRRRFLWARALGVVQVGLIVLGWALGRYPYLMEPQWTLQSAAAPPATLRLLLGALGVGLLVLIPSLRLLFRVFKSTPVRSDA